MDKMNTVETIGCLRELAERTENSTLAAMLYVITAAFAAGAYSILRLNSILMTFAHEEIARIKNL